MISTMAGVFIVGQINCQSSSWGSYGFLRSLTSKPRIPLALQRERGAKPSTEPLFLTSDSVAAESGWCARPSNATNASLS